MDKTVTLLFAYQTRLKCLRLGVLSRPSRARSRTFYCNSWQWMLYFQQGITYVFLPTRCQEFAKQGTEMASSLTYSKMSGFATTTGQEFEFHLCALLFLRARNSGLEFQLGSNVMGAAALDDVVFRCKTLQEPNDWKTMYVQLKHKDTSGIKRKWLTSHTGDFSLWKYFKSYLEIKEAMSTKKETLFDGSFQDSKFVIYTNAKGNISFGKEFCGDLSTMEEFIRSGSGSVFCFERSKKMLECLGDCGDEGGLFLSRLRMFCNQPNADELKIDVKEELRKLDAETVRGLSIERLCDCYLGNVKDWWASRSTKSDILDNGHDILLSALDKVRLESDLVVEWVRLVSCSEQTLKANILEVEFEEASLPSLAAGLSIMESRGGCFRLSLTKLVQASQCQSLVLTCRALRDNKRALLAERLGGDIKRLIVYTEDWHSDDANEYFEIIKHIIDVRDTSSVQDIVFLHDGNSSIGRELTEVFQGRCQSCSDEFKISQLKDGSRDKVLNKLVNLQGQMTTLGQLFNNDRKTVDTFLNASLVVAILENVGPLTVGAALPEGIGYFVERTLEWACVKASVFHDIEGTVTIMITQSEASTRALLEKTIDFVTMLQESPILSHGNKENILITLYRSQLAPSKEDDTVYVGPKVPLGLYKCNFVGLRFGQNKAVTALRVCPSKDTLKKASFLFVSNETNVDDVKKLSEFYQSEHLLSLKDGQLRWNQSHGDIKFVRQHFDEGRAIGFSPKTATDVEDRLVLVCAEPGMGKSTLMVRLAKNTKEAFPHYYVILLSLNDHTKLFAQGKHTDALAFLSCASQMDSPLELSLLKLAFDVVGNIFVIADGFDEIAPKYANECCQLLSNLLDKSKTSYIWTTSRNSIKEMLEKQFSKFPTKLLKFDENGQQEFFKKFWAGKSTLSMEDLDKFIDQLLVKTSQAVRDKEKNFMGIPLQTQMLAEVYEDHVNGSVVKSKLPDNLDLLVLLEQFVDKKFSIYFRDKLKILSTDTNEELFYTLTRKDFIDNHEKSALNVIIGDDQLKTFRMEWVISETSEFCQKISSGKDKTGFIVDIVNDKPRFIHRVFAEYFVAKWISEHFANDAKLIRSKLFSADFSVVRSIINRIFSRNCPLHTAVLNEDLEKVQILLEREVELVKAKDVGGRTALHLAAGLGTSDDREENVRRGEIVDLLNSKTIDFQIDDNVLGNPPLKYADITQSWVAIDKLLRKSDNKEQLLLTAANVKHKGMLEIIFDLDLDRLLGFCLDHGLEVEHFSEGEKRLLIRACEKGSLNVASLLIDRNAHINFINGESQNPLHLASAGGFLDIVKLLYQKLGNLTNCVENTVAKNISNTSEYTNIKDDYDMTAIHLAAESGHSNVISFLISQGSGIQTRSLRNISPLKAAANFKSPSAVRALLEAVSEADRAAFVNSCEDDEDCVLNYAARQGSLECFEVLVQAGAKLTQVGFGGETPLMNAAREGQQEVMGWLVHNFNTEREGMSVLDYINMNDNDGRTAMHHAAENGQSDMISFLINQGGDSKGRDLCNRMPLHMAALGEHPSSVRRLLETVNEADLAAFVNSRDNDGDSALNYAARGSSLDCFEILVQVGAKLVQVGPMGVTALMTAAKGGKQEIVEWLLHNFNAKREGMSGLDFINKKDKDGKTAMHHAAESGHSDVISFLISQGGDTKSRDSFNKMPFHSAALRKHSGAVRVLLETVDMADQATVINSCDNDGFRALNYAARSGSFESVERLTQAGVQLSQVGCDGETPLMAAACKGNQGVMKCLLHNFNTEREGMSKLDYINMQDRFGMTAMHHTTENSHTDVISFLISQGGDTQIRDLGNMTPLYSATLRKNPSAIRILLEAVNETDRAAVVNLCDGYRDTVLTIAARGGNLNCVELLVQAGAKMSHVGFGGETALRAATRKGYLEIVECLLHNFNAEREGMSVLDYLNMKNEEGETAYGSAATECRDLMDRFLNEIG